MADSGQQPSFSCNCLNVRVKALPQPSNNSPEEIAGEAFTNVYVGEEGIDIAHTQLTLRNRGPKTQRTAGNSTEATRLVTLTCMICQTLVYQVFQVIPSNVDGGEGPVLPTEEWAESEILKSSQGWIQVSKTCLAGKSVQDAENSPAYSPTFRIILPSTSSSTSQKEHYYVTPPPASPDLPSSPRDILPHIPSLFPPAPFTPTHPVFVHLAALANEQSEKLRTDAENELRKIVEEKVGALKAAESKLKQDVERLWSTFKATVERLEQTNSRPSQGAHKRSGSKHSNGTPNGVNGASSVRVNDFVPAPTPPRTVSASVPAVSALSASLATSSLHNAMAAADSGRVGRVNSPARSTARSTTVRSDSPSTASSKTLGLQHINGEAEIRDAYRRNMDQSLDFATSFKYMIDIGAHVQSKGSEVPETLSEEDDAHEEVPSPTASQVPRGRSPRAGKSAIKKPKTQDELSNATASAKQSPQRSEGEGSVLTENTTPKGKRKVTFDVKPDVAIIASETPKFSSEKGPKTEEAVFDMEHENAEEALDGSTPSSAAPSQPASPAPEPAEPIRRSSRRAVSLSGLPASFSSLRPASLPLPSAIRPPAPVPTEQVDERSRSQSIREAMLSQPAENEVKRREMEAPRELPEDVKVTDPHEAEILRLVAASTPSHRSAWKKDSSAWRTFVARQKAQKHERSSSIPEEDESSATDGPGYYDESGDDSDETKDFWSGYTSVARSLPIPIGPLGTRKVAVQPKIAGIPENLGKASSAAMRRASYAERDRNRELDPGALDFTAEEDEVDEEEEFAQLEKAGEAKSLQRARMILKKRSEIPGEGMWRSLA